MEEFLLCLCAKRVESFKDWPFLDDCSCTPQALAAAGFYHVPADNCPDRVRCFFCHNELDGWNPDDEPLAEHRRYFPECGFLALEKQFEEMTVEEALKASMHRQHALYVKDVQAVLGEMDRKFKVTLQDIDLKFGKLKEKIASKK